jgi:HlyD family secretion protein
MDMKRILVPVLVIGAAATFLLLQPWRAASGENDNIVLYGNVDLRQVALAFKGSERVQQMLVEEGDSVEAGQVLAVLDTTMLELRIRQAQAQARVQQEGLNRLRSGSRPQELAQAEAASAAAQADLNQAQQQLQRLRTISIETAGQGVSQLDIEMAEARFAIAEANLQRAQQAQDLSVDGPASEDIAQAEAMLEAANAELALLQQQLLDAQLRAPIAAIVRSRLMEPGEMASPQRPAYSLAITEPKWVRAYVSETQLGRVTPGQSASVTTDSHPDQPLQGSVGYISSVAEFTPKAVQTENLRTSLVYEIRIRVSDPDNRLLLGMPATVNLGTGSGGEPR